MEPIRTLDELAAVLANDERFQWPVHKRGDGFIELRVGDAGITLADVTVWKDEAKLEPHLVRAANDSTLLILLGSEDEFEGLEALRDRVGLALEVLPMSRARLYVELKNHIDHITLRARATEKGRWAERYRYELGELIAIGRAISSERDIHKLLSLILEKSRYITSADAGSVYIVEGQSLDPRERTLRFMASQNYSIEIETPSFTMPVNETSIVGRAVISREIINIPNLYELDEPDKNPWGFQHDKGFDQRIGYQGRSMLTVPMVNQRDEVIGVIQLINRRKDGAPRLTQPKDFDEWVIPFDKRSEELCATLASQAGVSLENSLLYEDIRNLFEGFVSASVTAIESRDPTTSGHSNRVAQLTVGLAQMVDRESAGDLALVHFTVDDLKEIEYAGLLHDFGKVGVREKVLVKAKKLYEYDRDLVVQRFDYIRKALEADGYRKKLDLVALHGPAEAERQFAAVDEAERQRLQQLDEYVAFVLKANEPTVLPSGGFEKLSEIGVLTYSDPRGELRPYLTEQEILALKLPRGSLTEEERREIESHVIHTYNFLETIPWGRRLGKIPQIAGSHHEKLDGTGYPRGLKAQEIRVETRMMTIADIFDALTASDRPYKKAVPVEKALDIISYEVKGGKCDPELFRIFIEAKVWHRILPA